MRILRRLMDELLTDIEIAVEQIPGREFRTEESRGYRFCPVIEAPASPGDSEKRVYFIGGPCGGISEVTLDDGRGCSIRIERRLTGWIIVEIRDDAGSLQPIGPKVYTALLKTGETVEFNDCHGRTVQVTRLRRRVSRPRLRKLGVDI